MADPKFNRNASSLPIPKLSGQEQLLAVSSFPYCIQRFKSGDIAGATNVRDIPIRSPEAIKARTDRLVCDAEFNPADYQHPEKLAAKANYIADEFQKTGAKVELQNFQYDGKPYVNVIARYGSLDPTAPLRIVGFHYDKHGEHPGAKDNDVSVATGLELARELGNTPPKNIRVQLVAYTLEECSVQKGVTGEDPDHPVAMDHIGESRCYANHEAFVGSKVHAESIRQESDAKAVVLDAIGSFSNKPGSQRYEGWLAPIQRRLYGDRGNYVAVVGNLSSNQLSSNVAGAITTKTGLPANAAAVPQIGLFEHYFRSDHANYPRAVLVTDTANFRLDGKHDDYHSENDTPDQVKYSKVAKVAEGISEWLRDEDRSAAKK